MKTIRATIAILALATGLSVFAQTVPDKYLGTPIPVSDKLRTITIGPDTKHVNVDHDEAVRFVVGETTFAWRFDGAGARSVNLQQVAPGGALARPVTVYVTRKGNHP